MNENTRKHMAISSPPM